MAKLGKISYYIENKRQRTPKGQSKMGNPENLTTRRRKNNTICVGYHYTQM